MAPGRAVGPAPTSAAPGTEASAACATIVAGLLTVLHTNNKKQYDTIRVGVLGGGQLGRMMAIAGHNINVEVIPLDPKGLASPAGQVASSCVQGSFKDQEKIKILAEKMYQPGDESKRIKRVMTVEIEHVNCDAMDAIQSSENIPIYPSPATVRLIQDKYVQKDYMRKSSFNIPTSNFEVINGHNKVAS